MKRTWAMTVIGAWVGACGGGSGARTATAPSETEKLWAEQPASPMVSPEEKGLLFGTSRFQELL